ncbi:GNAT family N-acetyltransferase [Tessaracoccus sp. OH4464_COT-324]|uniref:GNAT family N-acetyltransferase n=1 Tax=Tessaracoccus sp. OH4464_COT-324 TaxID=2491059 RepID=UPI000F640E35|nr:GNAT family N-acetyltransferase [Tessaracoccus sp. OH4464_COT-324]RRD48030.1 N-acetyltransferase [Tessaracoccus sp. OH4464_COT-324]
MEQKHSLKRNDESLRYELRVGDQLAAFVDFLEVGGVVELPHTETLPDFRGQGLAAQVVDFALDEIAAAGHEVRATCPFAAERLAARGAQ